jgi:putative membrane protein
MATLVDKYFSQLDIEAIERAIGDAEAKSSGELVVQMTSFSKNWLLERVLVSIAFGMVGLLLGLLISREHAWGWQYHFDKAALGGLVGFLVGYFGLFRLLQNRKRRRSIVWKRALDIFSTLTPTKGNTAVLIFVSLEEEQSAIVADKLIASKLPADYWDKPQSMIMDGIAKGAHAEGIIEAIHEIGAQLAIHFPRQSDDTNELPNKPTILDR